MNLFPCKKKNCILYIFTTDVPKKSQILSLTLLVIQIYEIFNMHTILFYFFKKKVYQKVV